MTEEKDRKLKDKTKIKVPVKWVYPLIGFVAGVVVFSMGYIYYLGNHMALVHLPLVEAAMEIKNEATTAHLYFKKILSGDSHTNIDEILEHIDKAEWYAKTMLEGGQSTEGIFFPLSDLDMRREISEVRHDLAGFKEITLQQWRTGKTTEINTDIDQKYDGIFKDFIQRVDLVKTNLKQRISKEIHNFQIVQVVLIAVCMVVTVVVGMTFSSFLKNQIRNKLELQTTNQQLIANELRLKEANQQLTASEQQARIITKFPSENPNPILRISKDGVVLYSNEPGKIILDAWSCDEKQCLCLPERVSKLMKIVLSSGKPAAFDIEHRNRAFSITLAPVIDSDYINIYAHDITDRKRAQEKLLEYQKKLKTMASQLSVIEERERHRVATDLHDHIGQSLVMSKMKLDSLRESMSSDCSTKVLDEVCNCLGDVIRDTRTLTFDLSSPILYELGFETAVAEWLDEQVRQKHGIQIEFEDNGQPKPLDDDISALLFRNVRELLINVVKHAKAQKVKVYIDKVDDGIFVKIEDDGVGFEPAEIVLNTGFGIFSIRERLEQLGGRLEIESRPGFGSSFTMTAPLKLEKKPEGVVI